MAGNCYPIMTAMTQIPHRGLDRAVIQKILERQKNACYVLITCQEPTDDGQMHVEMTYDGDMDLAAYLIESAHRQIG